MRTGKRLFVTIGIIIMPLFSLIIGQSDQCQKTFSYDPPIKFDPKIYIANSITNNIKIDGILNDDAWLDAPWSQLFQDIEGNLKPPPERDTKIKMLWNEEYLYVGALMTEDHLWYTLTQKDDIMFHDDDFEIFIDPDGDGHNYIEIEINEYNAVWDLFLMFPYRIRNKHNHLMNWEAKGFESAVHLEGSVNDPSDIDKYWSLEMAIPLDIIKPFTKSKSRPVNGDYWRINFSRVDWLMNIDNGNYIKRKQSNGKNMPERNWVWSPMGVVNMHIPELWGYLFFSEGFADSFQITKEEKFKHIMWQTYHAVKSYSDYHGVYPEDLKCIQVNKNDLEVTKEDFRIASGIKSFEIMGQYKGKRYIIDESAQLQVIDN